MGEIINGFMSGPLSGLSWLDPKMKSLMETAKEAERLNKALLTGTGIVQSGDQGGRTLRTQFMPKLLETVSYEQDDAVTYKLVPKNKTLSTAVEYTNFISYGGAGSAFVGETGSDGNFNVAAQDNNFARQVQNVAFLGVQGTVGLVSELVQSIEDPMQVTEKGLTLALIAKIEQALYWADSTKVAVEWNSFPAQIMQWLDLYPNDSGCLYDMGNNPLDQPSMEDIAVNNRLLYGKGSLLLSSVNTFADIQKALFSQGRYLIGEAGNQLGQDRRSFKGPNGSWKLQDAVMLRKNAPLAADGPGVTGLPRATGQQDAGSQAIVSNPFYNTTPQSPGTGNFWRNSTRNTDGAGIAAPALPTGPGNQGNRLAAGNYFYGVSCVYQGLESVMWVAGAAAAGTLTSASTIAPTAGQIVPIAIDTVTPCVTGLGVGVAKNNTKWRVYRAPATATSFSQFALLGDTGTPTAGYATLWDNGYTVPGTDIALLITESKNGVPGWGLWNLLPLIKRDLPPAAMADLFALLYFGVPIIRVPRHATLIRNIGPWVAS